MLLLLIKKKQCRVIKHYITIRKVTDTYSNSINRWMEDDWLDLATKKLIEDKPNTFTYTKWIAESLLEREASEMPVVILRPSNIGAAWKEPFPVRFTYLFNFSIFKNR